MVTSKAPPSTTKVHTRRSNNNVGHSAPTNTALTRSTIKTPGGSTRVPSKKKDPHAVATTAPIPDIGQLYFDNIRQRQSNLSPELHQEQAAQSPQLLPGPSPPPENKQMTMDNPEAPQDAAMMDAADLPTPAQTATTTQVNAPDQPDAAINQHIANLSVSDKVPSTSSPPKKKTKSNKTNKTTSTKTPSSILKGGGARINSSSPIPPPHNHVFQRTVIDSSVVLTSEAERDRYSEFNHALGVLLKNAAMVDPTVVLNPLHPSSTLLPWRLPKDVPNNMTELGRFVFISSTPWRFKTHSQKRGDNTVYFSFTMSSDEPPADLCSAINMEWCRQNGDRLAVKSVQCHDTITPIALFFLWNEGATDTLVSELSSIFRKCWECALLDNDESVPKAIILPEFALKKSLPQIRGANTHTPSFGNNIPPQLQNARRVMHIEVGRTHADLIKRLVEIGKERQIFRAMWGKKIHPSEVLEQDAPMEARNNLASMAQDHASFIFGSRVERLIGVTQLDKMVDVKDPQGVVAQRLTLRDVLLSHFRTQDGATVFGSIHQGGMEEPFVVVQNSAEIESLLLRLNHQLPAFLLFYLQEKGLPKDFVIELLRKSCDVRLFADAFNCKWDATDQVITRPDEEELRKKKEEEEKANKWYRDIVNMHLVTNQKSPTKAHIAPEARYDLDAERSVTTINVHKKKKVPQNKSSAKTKKAQTTAKSTGDSDSSGDDESDSDSASENARKPFSTVGFEKKTEAAIEIDSSSSSSEESSAESDGESQGPMEGGGGG